jgi:phospholipid-transporting ATPase
MIFCLIILLAIIMTVLKVKTRNKTGYSTIVLGDPINSLLSVFGWMLNLTYWLSYCSNLVPISLIVTLETVKLLQGKVITMDPKMHNNDFESKVNSSYSVEDLGTVEFVASDKTGTLTKNQLTLR